ncbi:MAG: helix-turn-helix domain-containing protein [Bacteroidota bacterium]
MLRCVQARVLSREVVEPRGQLPDAETDGKEICRTRMQIEQHIVPIESLSIHTVSTLAAWLHVSQSLIRRLVREDRIPYFKLDGRYLFHRPSVEEWILSINNPATGGDNRAVSRKHANSIWNQTVGS